MLLGGLVCAAVGGELFVRSAVGIAAWARVPAGIIGATVAAFATSSPEVSVAIGAAADGRPEIALGDALGSNVVNIALVLGLALLFGPIASPRDSTRRDVPFAVIIPLATIVLALDGMITRVDGAILGVVFIAWLFLTTRAARRERSYAAAVLAERSHKRSVVEMLLGLVFLVAAGRLIVTGAKEVGADVGLSTFVIGATMVAVGTSTPELATTLIARIRGHAEVGLGRSGPRQRLARGRARRGSSRRRPRREQLRRRSRQRFTSAPQKDASRSSTAAAASTASMPIRVIASAAAST